MKSALRALFAGLLVLAIVAQAARLMHRDAPADDADWTAALSHLGAHVATSTGPRTLAVTVPECAEPLTLARIDFDGTGDETARALLATAAMPRYAYLGYVGNRIDPVAIGARWAFASVLEVVGLRHDAAPHEVVVVMVPKLCPQLTGRDWSVLSPWG